MVKRKPEEEEENEENEDSTLQDGQRHRVPLYMKDGAINPELTPTQRAKAQTEDAVARKFGLTDARQLHRPGFRYNMDHAAFERTRQAYALADQEAANAWKGGAAVTVRGDAPRKDAALTDARAEAYRLYDEEMANAWRGPNR